MGRSDYASVCLDYGGASPQVLVTGGHDNDGNVLNDIWILDILSGCWKKVSNLWQHLVSLEMVNLGDLGVPYFVGIELIDLSVLRILTPRMCQLVQVNVDTSFRSLSCQHFYCEGIRISYPVTPTARIVSVVYHHFLFYFLSAVQAPLLFLCSLCLYLTRFYNKNKS